MHFIFSSDGLSMNLTEEIAKINKHNNLKLVVIDTLAKISRAEVNIIKANMMRWQIFIN